MNSIENLENMGIPRINAVRMLESYEKHIGEKHGDYTITDMTYLGDMTREIELTCRWCGSVRHKEFVNSKNKLSELATICPRCREERNSIQKEAEKARVEREKAAKIRARVGEIHGDYLITDVEGTNYICKCSICGAERTLNVHSLDTWKQSRCKKHYVQKIKYDNSYVGRKNNLLKIEEIIKDKRKKKAFLCICDCGNYTVVNPRFWETGKVKGCGCQIGSKPTLEHNPELDRLRRIYNGMMQRCYNPNSERYDIYGKRGIKICDEWLYNRDAFIEWALTHGHEMNLTIDRIDVNGNYEPSNCRWATVKEQANNRRDSHEWNLKRKYRIDGENYTLRDAAMVLGITQYRVKKMFDTEINIGQTNR